MSSKSLELDTQLIERIVQKRKERLARAEEEAERIVKTAEQEVGMIKADTERQVLSLVGSELRAVRDRIVGRTELDGRKMLMASRHQMLSSVFEEAEKQLEKIAQGKDPSVDYGVILGKLIVEAAVAMGGEEFIVAANERDHAFIKKNLRKLNNQLKKVLGEGTLKLDNSPLDIMGGVVVQNSEGTKTFYNTLDGRLENVKSRIQAEVGKILGVI
ncbi:MAG: hypothetical protein JSV18_08465 [Candidatus Bathyarchaeota archaeon]|nr:MAG: hypothetical protein JSV18_08465 [Candidatus Bathyarchaeota archaeon]